MGDGWTFPTAEQLLELSLEDRLRAVQTMVDLCAGALEQDRQDAETIPDADRVWLQILGDVSYYAQVLNVCMPRLLRPFAQAAE